jgi:flagellar motor protein MotB
MSKRAKKQHHEGHMSEGWVTSLADLMTLLMGFFVILCSMMVPKDLMADPEFLKVAAAIKEAFKYIPPVDSKDPIDLEILLAKLRNSQGKTGQSSKVGEAAIRSKGMVGRHDMVTTVRTGAQTTIGGIILFPADSAELNEAGENNISVIADQIRGHMNVFIVKGHTSRDEEYKLQKSKRDLSYGRASVVVDKLVSLGVARQALRIVACRDFEPIREGTYSEVTRADNRRVEVVATEALVSEYRERQPSEDSANEVVKKTIKPSQSSSEAKSTVSEVQEH